VERESREALGFPHQVYLGVSVAVGYPARARAAESHKPVEEVMHWERW
jgi:hypothetical protein